MKTADLHLHSMDQFDSQNNPEEVCARLKELGAEGFALTQHGTLSGIEPMRAAAKKYGLKFIPGVETYYGNDGDIMKNQHLVLLSRDFTGYKAISMAVTDGQNAAGYSVMNNAILEKYFGPGSIGHGHVIATSACIQGPLAAVLRRNEMIDHEIEKLQRRFKMCTDVSGRLEKAEKKLEDITKEVEEARTARDKVKKQAEMKFTSREKRLEKLIAKNDPNAEAEAAELERDRKLSEEAKAALEESKKQVAGLLRKQTVTRQEVKELSDLQDRYREFKKLVDKTSESRLSNKEMLEEVKKEATYLSGLFGEDCFYIEVQYHGIDKEKEIYPVLANLAKAMHLPLLATNDVHIVRPTEDERLRRQILRSLRFGEKWEEEGAGDSELYIKTDETLADWIGRILPKPMVDEAMGNIRTVLNACDVVFPENEQHYPKFPTKDGKTANEALEEEVRKGIRWRFPEGMDEQHQKRLDHELNVIESMGYADYHLIVKDFLEYGRTLAAFPENMLDSAPLTIEDAREWVEVNGWRGGISVGPGRGSAVGSLVCYLLGITSMDPIKYGLLFERFLNPERVSMPDIDVDLSRTIRQKVIQYVQHKYGENAVCGIMTTNAQAPRGAIRIAAKFYGLKVAEDGTAFKNLGDQMAKSVPQEPGVSFASDVKGRTLYESLVQTYSGNEHALEILRWAKVTEGVFTTYGAHAAGIVISDNKDIKEYLPLRWNQKLNEWTTMCDMIQVEEKGLLKMDFLGLKTLDVISGAIKAVHRRTGKLIEPLEIPLDDSEVFRNIFQQGLTNSVFQFESDGMKNMLKRFKPDTFDDLILLVAAYRPGPLQYLDGVIDAKTGKAPISYATPELEDILNVTYGYPIYQEQVMAIFQKLAGYTLGGADLVRRFMSKKKMDKLVHERESFIYGDPARGIDGCVKRGISEQVANELFDQMTEFAKYAFNKSHAAAYALIAYWTGWIKYHYPAEFLMEAMNWSDADTAIMGLMRETKLFGVQVLAPDVNNSQADFSVQDGKILFGLSSIKSVGEAGSLILQERDKNGPYTSLKDFYVRTQIKKTAENLIKAGALDAFCRNRQALLASVEPFKTLAKKYYDKAKFIEDAGNVLPLLSVCKTDQELLEMQKNMGISILDGLTTEKKLLARIENAKKAKAEAENALGAIILDEETYEDWSTRLAEEHEMLGAYVTGHPLDEYDADVATPLSRADIDTKKVFGIITSLKLTTRRTDGKPMAFFTIEDKTGQLDVSVFTKRYTSCAKYLKEGTVVTVTGRMVEEETQLIDENGMPVKVLKFIADSMSYPTPTRRVIMTVSSYAVFHVTEEEEFRKKYEDPDGLKCLVYDRALDQMRQLSYRISEKAADLPNIS